MANFMMGNRVFTTQVLVIGLAYFFLAAISIHFSKEAGNVAQFWYANALGIAFLLQFQGHKKWFLTFILAVANFGANWAMGNSWWLSIAFVIPNVIEMLVAPWLAVRLKIQLDFDQSPDTVLRFVLAVCLMPSGIGALVGASILTLLGFAPFSVVFPTWFVSSSVGTLSLLPFLILLKRRWVSTNLEHLNLETKKTFVFFAMSVFLVSFFALRYLPFPFIYLVIPLVFAAIYAESLVVSGLVFLQSLAIAVMLHLGYFQKAFDSTNVLSFLSYLPILVTFIPVLVLMGSMNLFRRRDKQRLETEEALQQKHLELQMIVNNVPAMIGFWDLELKNRFANNTYLDYFGWKPEDMLGVHMREIVGDAVYEKNLPHMQAALSGKPQVFERTLVNPNGLTREGLASYVPSYRDGEIEGVYVFVSDISDIKKAQRAEHIAQERLQAIIDSATEFSIIATDLQGTITLFSAGAEKMLGYTAAEMEHKVTPALIHVPEEAKQRSEELSAEFGRQVTGFDVFVLKATLGINEKREWTYVHKSGKKIPVRLVVTAIVGLDKKIVGFLGIANDISDEKELQRLLIQAKESAEQTSRAKSDFVANMSHEIRTPMNAVLGMSQLLASTDLSSEQRKYLEMIKVSGQSLMGILNDILDFSKIEANRLELSNTEFLLDDVLGALASMMAVSVGEKDVEVAIGMGNDVPKRLIGDQLRLQQILTNLTSNALKFTVKGEVAVFVDAVKDIAVNESADLENNRVWLKITVSDTGIGMDKQQLQKLFRPFSQADASTTRKFGGTGLGLSISNSIATLMGGAIEVKSSLGTGSEFQITVPMIAVNDTATPVSSTKQKRLNLLVVDDNSTSNNYICKTVRSWNWDTESASNGQQALDIVRARLSEGRHFDAIIVDWQMPMMDGLVTIKLLRDLLPKGKTPLVIMVSAFSRDRMLQDQAADYADAILMKPITGSSVFDTVHEAIVLCSGVEVMPRYSKAALTRSNQIQGAKLLLVEDNPFNQIVARGFLEQGGATVEVLENGYLAVEHLRSHADKYHAVLMDVQMPIMDGISATRMIRNELHLSIPVIAMTAGVMHSERERCLQSGMNDFIGKPIDVEQMFSAIFKVLPTNLLKNTAESGSSGESKPSADSINPESINAESGIFDPRSLEMLGKSDPKNMQKILTSVAAVIENASQQRRQVRAALDEQRFDDAARLLHTMRGSVGTLGAKVFAELSLKAEMAIRDDGKKDIDDLLLNVEDALQKTINAARHWLELKSAFSATDQGIVLPTLEGQALILQLRAQLQSNDIAACDLFLLVKENLSQKIPAASMLQLEKHINDLDFKSADLLLDKFSL